MQASDMPSTSVARFHSGISNVSEAEALSDEDALWLEREAEYSEQLQPLPTSMSNDLIIAVRKAIQQEEQVHVHFGFFLTEEEIMKMSASVTFADWEREWYKNIMEDKRYKDIPAVHGSRIVSILNRRLSALEGRRSYTPSFVERHTISHCASGSVFVMFSLGHEAFPGEKFKPALDIFQELSGAVGPKEPMWYFDGNLHGPLRFNCEPFKRKRVVGRTVARLLRAREKGKRSPALDTE
ncbi:hypothetical protein ONZ51_g473 [Trametes cubensis]|uniref:Uncharacterized protein n=1 Tax=Trametes cubensis TaxID=1111947 RepID=A0AAD7U3C6_9APHY|nr:hypothetical protein ONZ51_g473 [Trametes cubensis]